MTTQRLRKLTKTQREVLELLNLGHMMVIDRYNTASIGNHNIAPQTRYFLTENRYVCRKDKSKSVKTKGNGLVITDKGRRALENSPPPKKRGPSTIKKKEKSCPECQVVKPIEDFVTIYGFPNPRGKYCQSCFLKHQREHAMALMEGKDFCLYCGTKIDKAYDWTPEGGSARTYLNLDHMDPLSLGGEHSERNTVYCCVSCNLKKRDKPFTEWLQELDPICRDLSRKIYVKKHGREPEEFKALASELVISIDLRDLFSKL